MPARELGFLPSIPAVITSVWIWFYAGSGLVIKIVLRLRIGLHWFNRHMDIEKHPSNPSALCRDASSRWRIGRLRWPIGFYDRVTALYPQSAKVLVP